MAVLGWNFDLLVDHGILLRFPVSCWARTFDTIARKPEHDKAAWLLRGNSGLELRGSDCHCLACRPLRNRPEIFAMTQTSNRFFDEIGRLMNDAAGAAQGVKREIDTLVRNQAEKFLRDLDVVEREEFEAVKEMARLAREENEALKARISALEAKLGVSGSAPDNAA
jgi:BMFP domain-containing protein YqiC